MRAHAAITSVMGIMGAVLLVVLSAQAGDSLIVASVARLLAALLAALGLYAAWALPAWRQDVMRAARPTAI